MKVILAEHSGYCFGVKRAVDMAIETSEKSDEQVYSFGEIIHNTQVVNLLKDKGVSVIESIDEASGGKIIIRSHGVSENIIKDAQDKSLNIVDATCPFVKKIQGIVHRKFKEGYHILIVGDPSHPEVVGVNGWCHNQADIVSGLEDFSNLTIKKGKYAVVAQTTISILMFEELITKIKQKIPQAEIYNTICTATSERQTAAFELSKQVEAMIIIGGKKSSNTKKLAEVTSTNCITYLIETYKDIDEEEIRRYDTVGVTAGASTPDFIIEEVINFLKYL